MQCVTNRMPVLERIGFHLLPALLLLLVLSTSAFAQSEKKIAYAVLLDNTRSLEKQFPQVLLFGKGVVKQIRPRGPVSLFSFISKYDNDFWFIGHAEDKYEGRNSERAVAALGVEWSQDEKEFGRYIDALPIVKGNTALLEAIESMAEALDAKVNSEKESFKDKVIILITDGEHREESVTGATGYDATTEQTKEKTRQLIKLLKSIGIRVYAVGLIRDLNSTSFGKMSTKDRAEAFLKKITKETGGRVDFPKSKGVDVESVLSELLAQ